MGTKKVKLSVIGIQYFQHVHSDKYKFSQLFWSRKEKTFFISRYFAYKITLYLIYVYLSRIIYILIKNININGILVYGVLCSVDMIRFMNQIYFWRTSTEILYIKYIYIYMGIHEKNKNYKALKLNHNPLENYVELLKYSETNKKISRINNVVF